MRTYPHPARSIPPLCLAVTLGALDRLVPRARIDTVLAQTGRVTERLRKLDLGSIMLLVIALSLFAQERQPHVLRRLFHAYRLRWPTPPPVPTASAICYRRAELGVAPLRQLFHQVCVPLAPPGTPGAWLAGYRLMAIDGTVEEAADTPATAARFGRSQNQHGAGAYPQVRCVYLVECGTHAVVGARFRGIRSAEVPMTRSLLPRLTPEMLVTLDRGLYSYALLAQIRARGAEALVRVPAQVSVRARALLPDGSYLAVLLPDDARQRRRGVHQVVRLIEYTLPHPQDPTRETTYRLVCTVLDVQRLPAETAAQAYTERWEVELTLDEQTVHQRLPQVPLRSQTPAGVYQELYGALIAHYALRAVMRDAARQAGVDPDRISFVHTLRTVQRYLPDLQRARGRTWTWLYRLLLEELGEDLLPPRRSRACPRLIKRRINRYTIRTPARVAQWRRSQTTRDVELK